MGTQEVMCLCKKDFLPFLVLLLIILHLKNEAITLDPDHKDNEKWYSMSKSQNKYDLPKALSYSKSTIKASFPQLTA